MTDSRLEHEERRERLLFIKDQPQAQIVAAGLALNAHSTASWGRMQTLPAYGVLGSHPKGSRHEHACPAGMRE